MIPLTVTHRCIKSLTNYSFKMPYKIREIVSLTLFSPRHQANKRGWGKRKKALKSRLPQNVPTNTIPDSQLTCARWYESWWKWFLQATTVLKVGSFPAASEATSKPVLSQLRTTVEEEAVKKSSVTRGFGAHIIGRHVTAVFQFSHDFPTNIASVNLVISYNKVFSHYSNTCAGVLTLYK